MRRRPVTRKHPGPCTRHASTRASPTIMMVGEPETGARLLVAAPSPGAGGRGGGQPRARRAGSPSSSRRGRAPRRPCGGDNAVRVRSTYGLRPQSLLPLVPLRPGWRRRSPEASLAETRWPWQGVEAITAKC
eukprot:gene9123-biopygen22687